MILKKRRSRLRQFHLCRKVSGFIVEKYIRESIFPQCMGQTLTIEERRTIEAMKKEISRLTGWDYLFIASVTVFALWVILKLNGVF